MNVPLVGKCHQRVRREQTLEEDLRTIPFDVQSLRAKEFVIGPEKYSPDIKKFIMRYEWLGTVGVSPKWVFTARLTRNGVSYLGGVLLLNEPVGYSKMLPNTVETECLIQRGACAAWTPPNLASRMIMWAVRWMVKNTSKRLFAAFSDFDAGEVGTVYQAANWTYLGDKHGANHSLSNPIFRNGRPFSPQVLRRTSTLKWWCKHTGRPFRPEWLKPNGFKDLSLIPDDVKNDWYAWGVDIRKGSNRVPVRRKGKYCYVLGRTPRETAQLRSQAKITPIPYPKRSINI